MRAMLLERPGPIAEAPLVLREVPEPAVGPDDVLVRVEACGVCHTDLHTVEGELDPGRTPVVPGHQVVGRVERTGQRVTRFRPGERVGLAWLGEACGDCPACRRGRENLCPTARFTGFHRDGGYAELAAARAEFAYPVSETLDAAEAAPLLCAGIIGYRALALSEVRPGETLALFGFGASAHVVLQLARHRGIRCLVFSRGDNHRRLARELGAEWTGAAGDEPPRPAEGAILFAPAGALVPAALAVLAPGGTLAIASIYLDPIPQLDYGRLLYGERTVRSVTASTRQDGEGLLAEAAAVPVRTHVQTYPLASANFALADLAGGRVQGAAVLMAGASRAVPNQHAKD